MIRITYNKMKLFDFFLNKKSKVIEKNKKENDDDKCKCRIGLKPIESA